MIKMDQDEFLARKGLSFCVSDYTLDQVVFPHGETARQRQKRIKNGEKVANEYQQKRHEAINEYKALVEAGEIEPKSSLERSYQVAMYGHPDNESTQAARRMLNRAHCVYNSASTLLFSSSLILCSRGKEMVFHPLTHN